jgi:hypothetical protein
MRKVWFMDVDGVMAPFSKGGAFRDWRRSPHPVYELWLSPTQAETIRAVLDETGTELIWVTTWADEVAEYVESFLGWPNHRFAPLPHPDVAGGDHGPSGRWWKLDAVEGFLTELEPERCVWSDDDHHRHHRAVQTCLAGFETSVLVQRPKSYVGLSERLLREAFEHLRD